MQDAQFLCKFRSARGPNPTGLSLLQFITVIFARYCEDALSKESYGLQRQHAPTLTGAPAGSGKCT